jgi:serine/threonine-protein kinase
MAGIEKERWARISPLLDELLDADATSRTARLAQLRQNDAGLADQVAALLNQHAALETAEFLEGSVLASTIHELAGQVVGSYTLERTLGAGGMGTVWLARRSDGRYEGLAAVKFLNLALLDRGGTQRFRREGNALARLKHPHIAHLVDAGVTGGQPYLVLEYVEGEPIDRWCDGHELDVGARIRLFLQVLSAVSHAHGKLILHRDLKPSNILVTSEGAVKLLDFGIAKLLEEGEQQSLGPAVTQIDGRAFTPEFAAPEQVEGGETSVASDVYTLGVLFYLLLVGTHPTASASGTPVERMRALIETEPRRMSQVARSADQAITRLRAATPAQLARALGGDLDNIVAKALKKTPAERYATVDALAADLLRHLNHEPVSARADSLRYRAGKFIVRNKLIVASVVSVVFALAAGAGVAVWQALEANQRRVQAELEARQARASHDLLYLVYSDPAVSPDAATMLERLAKVRTVIRQSYEDPELKTALLMQLGGRYLELSALDQLLDLLTEVRQVAPPNNPSQQAVIACGFVNAYVSLGRFEDAQHELAVAANQLRNVKAGDLEARAECLAAESQFATHRGDFARALMLAKQGADLFEQQGRTRDSRYTTALNQLSIGYAASGDFPRAYATTRKARDVLAHQGLGDTQKDLLDALQEIQLLNLGGKPAAALALTESLLNNPRVARQSEVPRFALDYHHGIALLRLARYPAAVTALEAGYEGARGAGQRNFMLNSSLWLLDALVQSGRIADAQARLAATPGVEDEIGKASQAGVIYLLVRARVALAQGAPQQADGLAQRALQGVQARKRRSDTQLRGATMMAARSALARQDWARASALADAALERARAEAIDPKSSAFIGEALLVKAESQRGAGNGAAVATASEALPHLQENLGPDHPLAVTARRLAQVAP